MKVTEKPNDLNHILEKLWEGEEPPKQRAVTLYQDTYHKLPDGRYSVCLPRLNPSPELGESRQLFLSNKLSLQRKGQLSAYNKVLSEYEELNHSEKVPDTELTLPPTLHYYLPETSTTTKLCIVFDASAKTSSGYSLIDTLLPTPSLYLFLTSFWLHPVAISSDISKMFREVVLDPAERNFHRFLRRSDKNGEVKDHRMKRLTFEVGASPYLATRILQQVATNNQIEFPEAADTLKTSFYVDDCLTGTSIPLKLSLYNSIYAHPDQSRNDTPEMEE